LPTCWQTAEELIVAKLRMAKATIPWKGSLKDVDDVKVAMKRSSVNTTKLRKLARENSVLSILDRSSRRSLVRANDPLML